VQTTGACPTQSPPWQSSSVVQAFPSSQDVPSGADGFEQRPVAGEHSPAVWHTSIAAHTTGLAPEQDPD
jgi:hypothetical protein